MAMASIARPIRGGEASPNPSFETPLPGGVGGGWAQIGVPWVTQGNSPYQQNSLAPTGSAHFTSTSPGGGVWYALINGNTVSITEDLLANVNVGDTLSMTFYGGRGQSSSSTADGGVFDATFQVGSTPYSMQVDTTVLANNTWQSYTLTRTLTNSGDLSLQFSAVSGDPWLDNISSINISNATSVAVPVLSVMVTNPASGQAFLTGSAITASATVANGAGPYTVTYYTNAAGGTPMVAGAAFSAPFAVSLGALTPGTYRMVMPVLILVMLRAFMAAGAGPEPQLRTRLVATACNMPLAV